MRWLSLFAAAGPLMRVAALAAALAIPAMSASAQTTFTYQGQLKSAGTAYSGTADMRFTLFNASSGGAVVGAAIPVVGVTVANGVFTVQLNFGPGMFDGNPRWLAIEIRTPSTGAPGGTYTLLAQRQPINPAPYAIYAMNNSSPFNFSGANGVFTGSGNIGIGTATPTQGKVVAQTAASTYGFVQTDGTRTMGSWVGPSGGWFGTTSNHDLNLGTNNLSGQMLLNTSGNLGIGTTSPNGRVHISGGPTWTTNGWSKSLNIQTVGAIELGGGGATKYGIGSSLNGLYFFTTTTENADVPASYYMTANASGQISIGPGGFAPHPDYRLHVKATALNGLLAESSGASYALVGSNTGGGNGVYGSASGANSRGGSFWTSNGFCAASGDHTGGATYGLLGTANEGIYGNGGPNGKVGITGVAGGSSSSGIVASHVGTSTSAAGLFGNSLASNGNGVIGEANTGTAAYGVWGRATQGYGGVFSGGTYAIWAQGKAKVNTIEIVGGSDLAEPFDVAHVDAQGSQQDIEPGMVVVIDPANPGALKVSTAANDRKVAGIISGANDLEPGMVMKSEGGKHVDGDHPVALTGRVWCWCDARASAIEPGDMLTTSDTAGHAMKVADLAASQGAIIGKAMTPLAIGERGLVLVLVNLQ